MSDADEIAGGHTWAWDALGDFHHRLGELAETAAQQLGARGAFKALPAIIDELIDAGRPELRAAVDQLPELGMTLLEVLDTLPDEYWDDLASIAAARFLDEIGWPADGEPVSPDVAAAGVLIRIPMYRKAAFEFRRKLVEEETVDLHQLPHMLTAVADLGAFAERLSEGQGVSPAQAALARSHLEVSREGGRRRGAARAAQADRWRVPAERVAFVTRAAHPKWGQGPIAKAIADAAIPGTPKDISQLIRFVRDLERRPVNPLPRRMK